ncbi:Uncharacterised protein [Salmonella enterica subsp. enterica]|uniref:Uncharacterized protein n=1 Tax=Salmonella enterica I TaxID=59201 RepID=A0A3S4LX26_SALET|nr:Uncharacterised protein [Salmonella enterica subsp. enterica]
MAVTITPSLLSGRMKFSATDTTVSQRSFFCRYDIWIVVIDGNPFNWHDPLSIHPRHQLFKTLLHGVFPWTDHVENRLSCVFVPA